MVTPLRDGTTSNDPRLDRLVEFDEASRGYPIRALAPEATPTTVLWSLPTPDVLDQGAAGACVGFACTNKLRFDPFDVANLDNTFARETLYWGAQRDDPWPGGAYPGAEPVYEGTSVLAGVKEGAKLGFYRTYRWGFGEVDLAVGLQIGPAVLGLNWWTGMFRPDRRGYLRRTGQVEGGHAILCVGFNARYGYYTVYNSWGAGWGRPLIIDGVTVAPGGTAKIRRADMAALLADNGEACFITHQS